MTTQSGTSDFDALLIVGHGTRDPAGLAEFRSLAEQVARRKTDWHVAACYLELAEPSIGAAVEQLAARGLRRIRAMPLVLFSAGHAKQDIPEALAQAVAQNPGVEIELCPPIGCHPQMVELSIERCRQALSDGKALPGQPPVSPDETLLVLVGRGSSDEEAIAQMHELAKLRRAAGAAGKDIPFGRIDVAFAAVASPGIESVLEQAAHSGFRRIIVQPHLLFAGSVLSQIRRLVDRRRIAERGSRADRQWIVTDPAGPDARLVTAVIDRVSQTIPPVGSASG
jgi:sirohydrochlorin cobaltochelatase